jgi:hypothetical protein
VLRCLLSCAAFWKASRSLVSAAALGRAVSAAAASAKGTRASDASCSSSGPSSSSSGPSSNRSVQQPGQLAAPFVSVIGRCLYLTGAALSARLAAVSKEAPVQLEAAEFSSCTRSLTTLLSGLEWVAAEPACLSGRTGAAQDASAVSRLCSSLRAELGSLQHPTAVAEGGQGVLQGRAIADRLVQSGLAAQLQAVGAGLCGVTTGVCGNPGCTALSELSEIALVTPSGANTQGSGKCSGCGASSYCSRWVNGWVSGVFTRWQCNMTGGACRHASPAHAFARAIGGLFVRPVWDRCLHAHKLYAHSISAICMRTLR